MATTENMELMDMIKNVDCDEIIVESEVADGGSEEVEEYEIHIIEEIDESEEQVGDSDQEANQEQAETENNFQNAEERTQEKKSMTKPSPKHTLQYSVEEDWEEEDGENIMRLDSAPIVYETNDDTLEKRQGNKRTIVELAPMQASRSTELTSKKPRITMDLVSENEDIGNNDGQHEIIQEENDLVYTVLEPKKTNHAYGIGDRKSEHQVNASNMNVNDAIFFEDGEGLYVTSQQSGATGQHYEYNDAAAAEQEWENSQQSMELQQDDSEQNQIFLHEDEDGQLYFKNDKGTMQLVYLTEDGNYAIAGNSGDEQDSQEAHMNEGDIIQPEEDSYIIPDQEAHSTGYKGKNSSTVQDADNEDSTVTISLIISEDEHGQKRTQVIIPTAESHKCDICNKSFKTSFQLLKHNRLKHAREEDITTRNFPCDSCPKRFPDQNSLARHRKIHTGDRPYQCLECQKTFPTPTTLRRHLTLHNPQSRPLPCIYCGRRFLEKASLDKHEQSHLAGEMKTHTCDICNKTFNQASDLLLHKKNHDPDRKFDCEVCGREFNRLNNLQRHMMVHKQQQGNNDEILSCDICGITYKFMSSLTRHMVTTHVNPEKMRQQAEEQRRKRENNYRRYMENRKMYETQTPSNYAKRAYHKSMRLGEDDDDDDM